MLTLPITRVSSCTFPRNSNVWLGIKRSESGDYVRQDDESSLIQYSNWGAEEPAVLEESSGVVLDADETSQELGSWFARAVTERHGTVCERGRKGF